MSALAAFLAISVALCGSAAFAAGRAAALAWSPRPIAALYGLLVALAARFLHYALAGEPLLSARGFALDLGAALAFLSAGYMLARRRQMRVHYGALLAREKGGQGD
ncbi:DUF6867 family protein [Methylocella sp.]|uniref:DUF6867 family protein n=1 Tax=Methylocella sp. TaxID=1978226 RepID=UPI003783A206